MREQFNCGLQISLSKCGRPYRSGRSGRGTNLRLIIQRFFRREHVVVILLAALLPIEIACGGSSGGPGGPGGGTAHYYATGRGPTSVATGDFNGDKIMDLAVTNSTDNSVSVLLGNGDGTFQQHVDYPALPLIPGTSLTSIAVADFNSDGKQDLVADGLLLGNGDGTFQAIVPLSVTDSAPETKLLNAHSASAGTSSTGTVAVGDMNGDGKPDLVFLGGILLSNGDGTFREGDSVYDGYAICVAIGDFNGDGKLDVAQANSDEGTDNPNVTVYLGKGDGTLDQFDWYGTGWNAFGYAMAVNDFNGDGKLDILIGIGTNVGIYLGNGDATFQPIYQGFATAGDPFAIAVGDFNGDGTPDVAVVNGNAEDPGNPVKGNVNTVSILLGNGDGTFRAHVDYPTGMTPTSVAVGDFNGDGKLDLAVTNKDDNTVSILLGNGDGTFR